MRQDEKKTFYSFLALYLGSAFLLLLIISVLFYQLQYKLRYDLSIANMQNQASKISSSIVHAHMKNKKLDIKSIYPNDNLEFALYDKKEHLLYGYIKNKPLFNKKSYIDNEDLFIVDKSAMGHLGVYYVVIKQNSFFDKIYTLKRNIIASFILLYFILCFIGYFLAKLFIRPIQAERKRLDTFIKNTTHELNTPISALMMCTEQSTLLNSEKNIQRINLSAKRISEIYKDLTYLFLTTKNKLITTPISIDEIINKQIKYLEPIAEKKKIKLSSTIEPTKFIIDEESCERLISNLISNAIKYNKLNGTIDIELKNNQLIVKDSGIGISKDKLKDIFIRYNRITNISGGFGIGLDIVSTICKDYNISLDVKSKEKKGSSFILKFP